MTSYELGETVLVEFPQTAAPGPKLRPAVVILDIGDDDLVVAPITSVARTGPGDLLIMHWRQAGLRTASWVRLAKVNNSLKQAVLRRIGCLTLKDRQAVVAAWQSLYDLKP
jgi:mRNA interferase MazF